MRKIPTGHLRTPAVYGGVVLLLLLLAFFAPGFSQGVGEARVAGRYVLFPLFRPRALQSLTLSWNGVALRFSRSAAPALEGFEISDAGAAIVLANNVRLRLTPGDDLNGSLSISPEASSTEAATGPLVIPFTLSGPFLVQGAGSALSWERGGRTYLLSLPTGARLDAESRLLTLPLDSRGIDLRMAGGPAFVASSRVLPARVAAQSPQLPDEKSLPSADQMQAAVARYVDAAYAGWTGTRYSAQDGLWKMPDGSAKFSDDIGVGLLAESLYRGTIDRFLPIWSDAVARQQDRLPGQKLALRTSVYAGNVRDFLGMLQSDAASDVDRARGLLAKSDPSLFGMNGISTLLADHGTPDLLHAERTLMAGVSAAGLDTPSALGLLDGLLDSAQEPSGGTGAAEQQQRLDAARAARELIDRRIIPSLRRVDNGVFLESGTPGQSVVKDNIRGGSLLLRAGSVLDYSRASAIGRSLIVTSLALADDSGLLPGTLTLASGRVVARAGVLAAESVYEQLPLDRYLPGEIPLSSQLGPGAWLWTAARLVSITSSDAAVSMVVAYPVGIPHYMAIQGLRPFTQIRLHSIPWHADPSYMKYSDGWTYDAVSRTLYLKLKGRAAQEEIDIRF
jgi:hypothetical protein